jgi:hypothetical protein
MRVCSSTLSAPARWGAASGSTKRASSRDRRDNKAGEAGGIACRTRIASTTKLYDSSKDQITVSEVERIQL